MTCLLLKYLILNLSYSIFARNNKNNKYSNEGLSENHDNAQSESQSRPDHNLVSTQSRPDHNLVSTLHG